MHRSFHILLILTTALLGLVFSTSVEAQEKGSNEHILYYLSADAEGIQQVYQYWLSEHTSRQITHAVEDVIQFGVAYDGLSVAYLSAGQLWLQPFHTEEAESLADVGTSDSLDDPLSTPVYSPDGQYIAYSDNGIWLFDLTTRSTRQLLVNQPLDLPDTHVSQLRIYTPNKFVANVEGRTTRLIVDIGIWEWNTVGVYDLMTDTLQEFETHRDVRLHTDLLPLSDGRVLLYGNNMMAGEPALHRAESLDDINTYTKIFVFPSLENVRLFAWDAVEIRPGIVRIFGTAVTIDAKKRPTGRLETFILDYDMQAGTAGDLSFISVPDDVNENNLYGPVSADGMLLPILSKLDFSDDATVGEARLLNLETGELTVDPFATAAGLFHWQPHPLP